MNVKSDIMPMVAATDAVKRNLNRNAQHSVQATLASVTAMAKGKSGIREALTYWVTLSPAEYFMKGSRDNETASSINT